MAANPDARPLRPDASVVARAIVARFPKERWSTRPYVGSKNFQSCDLFYGDLTPESRPTPLASVNRRRKTKRSAWTFEMRPIASVGWMTPAELRVYFDVIATAAEQVEWPTPPEDE